MLLALLGAVIATAALGLILAPDSAYRWRGWLAAGRYHACDDLFTATAAEAGMDPLLLKALAWRESEFDLHKVGVEGRGLLQVRESEARAWAAFTRCETFMLTDLFDAQTNLRVGAWSLGRSLERWRIRDRPEVFALAEYHSGWQRVEKWAAVAPSSSEFLALADPEARAFVEAVCSRRDFYTRHGW